MTGQPSFDRPDFPDAEAESRYEKIRPWIDRADVLFLSIQKSGRTWVRWFLHSYFGGVSNHSYSLRLRDMPGNDHCPSICFTADFFDLFDGKPGIPRHIFAEQLVRKPLILLLRDPRDVIVSYFHFTKRLSPDRFRALVPSGLLLDFIRSEIFGIERISRYQLMAQKLFAYHSGPKLLLNYECLWKSPDEGFRPLVEFL